MGITWYGGGLGMDVIRLHVSGLEGAKKEGE